MFRSLTRCEACKVRRDDQYEAMKHDNRDNYKENDDEDEYSRHHSRCVCVSTTFMNMSTLESLLVFKS